MLFFCCTEKAVTRALWQKGDIMTYRNHPIRASPTMIYGSRIYKTISTSTVRGIYKKSPVYIVDITGFVDIQNTST